eukprot:scaffold5810_cov148-Skeletonema_marinoi.AAC.9
MAMNGTYHLNYVQVVATYLGGASVRRCDEDWVKKKYEKILAKCKLYTQPRSIHMPRFLWFSVQNEWTYLSRIVPNLGSD